MFAKERYRYHQIHPLKLLTDFCAGFVALYPLWQHRLIVALFIMLVPPLIASFLILRFADLEPYKESAFGRYVAHYGGRVAEAVRLLGMIGMALGAWFHSLVAIVVGLAVIMLAWLRGVLFAPRRERP